MKLTEENQIRYAINPYRSVIGICGVCGAEEIMQVHHIEYWANPCGARDCKGWFDSYKEIGAGNPEQKKRSGE